MTCTTPHCTPHRNGHPLCCAVQSIAPQCTVRCTVHYVHHGLEGITWGSEAPLLQWSVATLLLCIVPYCTLHHCGSFCPLVVGEKTVGMLGYDWIFSFIIFLCGLWTSRLSRLVPWVKIVSPVFCGWLTADSNLWSFLWWESRLAVGAISVFYRREMVVWASHVGSSMTCMYTILYHTLHNYAVHCANVLCAALYTLFGYFQL